MGDDEDPPAVTLTPRCITTDAGPDIKGCRSHLQALAVDHPEQLIFDPDCFAHQYGLLTLVLIWALGNILMPTLQLNYSYFGTLSCVCHTLRDNADKFFEEYMRMDRVNALHCLLRRTPPRPISGRWGLKGAMEKYLLSTPWEILEKFAL